MMPLELPERQVDPPGLRQFPSSEKRAMTGREAAEREEAEQAQRRRKE